MKLSMIAAALALGMFAASPVLADDASAKAPAKVDPAAAAAKSQECSKQADAKGLHGKERKKFREQCKKAP